LRSKLRQAVKIRMQSLPSPEEVAGCSKDELAAFRREFPLSNLVPRSQVEQELQQAESRSAALSSRDAHLPNQSTGKRTEIEPFLQFLEQTYAKGKTKQKPDET
ncbi:MAG: hypothetical protein L0287_04690, partial [Anaerolineae bacterium]|nr:hypothetical protein [Anaerolineae bacterium]